MSEFLNIYKTFAKVLNDLSLGIDVIPENDDFDPPSAGQWAEFSILSQDITSMGKSGAGDEASGVCQISLYDAEQISRMAQVTRSTEVRQFLSTVYLGILGELLVHFIK